tara:strand:- start:33 stop:272 length:240 start_codon:yes stop_codon:yes gene_type:complete
MDEVHKRSILRLQEARKLALMVHEEAFDPSGHKCSACDYMRPTYPSQRVAYEMCGSLVRKIEVLIEMMREEKFNEPRGG